MAKPTLIQAHKTVPAKEVLNANGDDEAGAILLEAFAHALKECEPMLNTHDPHPDYQPQITVTFTGRGVRKPKKP